MPPKKRTSAAEKLTILRRLIVEGKCSWNLKELEKAGSKAGIVTQAIKDVLQSLCDDNLVDQDKIGSGSFFWSFASKNQLKLEHRIKKLLEEQAQLEGAKAELEARAQAASATRNAADRQAKLELYEKLVAERDALQEQMKVFQENSPEKIAKNELALQQVKAGVNRWTDNIWCAESYVKKKIRSCWQGLLEQSRGSN
eukprot:INCI19716.1.p1 GENE.INCI19716.1~~INCI19716.1.p1  ORF type:complete len:198 (-),score=47.92 INCI19716.1:85-678(-)